MRNIKVYRCIYCKLVLSEPPDKLESLKRGKLEVKLCPVCKGEIKRL
jgi:hypothetical protein